MTQLQKTLNTVQNAAMKYMEETTSDNFVDITQKAKNRVEFLKDYFGYGSYDNYMQTEANGDYCTTDQIYLGSDEQSNCLPYIISHGWEFKY